MTPDAWRSLDDELAVADGLFGRRSGALVSSWLEAEVARVSDREFAVQFCTNVGLPGIGADDYLHRLVHTSHGDLLAGIRFYGRDVNRPFVEIIAHNFGDLERLCSCVRAEWSMFTPTFLRLCTRPGRVAGPNVVLDISIYAARHKDMREPAPSVLLAPFANSELATGMVRRRYARLAADDPCMARNVSPAAADDLRRWHDSNELRAIIVDNEAIGLLAVAPGCLRWIDGDEITEEVVAAEHSGQGYAALAQAAWAKHVAVNPDRLLIGTIDRLNIASRKTADRAGRRRVLDHVFVSL